MYSEESSNSCPRREPVLQYRRSLAAFLLSQVELVPNRAAIVLYGVSFHTYRNVPSLAVATVRPRFRVARFNADRTFSLPAVNCANGTLSATPSWI
jgi:hypothetical protein